MANTNDNGDSRCFAKLLRHLLCRHGAPTHPSDTIRDPDSILVGPRDRIPKEESKLVAHELPPPHIRRAGVVARLMGLETLPDTKWIPCSKSPDVFSRSRSVNFMDYLLEVDLSSRRARRHRHRRVKTSVSFREVPVVVPTLLPPTKEDFIVVILEDRDEKEDRREMETRVRPTKCEAHRKKKKTDWSSKEKKVLKLRDEPRTRGRAACNHKLGQSFVSVRKSQRKVTRKQIAAAAADDADGSSPVSVLVKPERSLRKSASACRSLKAGSHESTSTRVARTLDPVTCPDQKVSSDEILFPNSRKHLDDAVRKSQMLADEEVGRRRWLLPDSTSREEICVMIEQHALDRLLEELVRMLP